MRPHVGKQGGKEEPPVVARLLHRSVVKHVKGIWVTRTRTGGSTNLRQGSVKDIPVLDVRVRAGSYLSGLYVDHEHSIYHINTQGIYVDVVFFFYLLLSR